MALIMIWEHTVSLKGALIISSIMLTHQCQALWPVDLLSCKKVPGKIKPREDQKWQMIQAEHGQQTLQHQLSWFVNLFHRLMKMQESMHPGTALKLVTSCHVRCANSDSQLQKLSYMLWIVMALEWTPLKMVQVCCFLWFATMLQFWPTPCICLQLWY